MAAGLFIVAVVCTQVGWLVAVPPGYGIDEFDHAFRASSVAAGNWQAGTETTADGRGVLIPVREDIVRASFAACDSLDYTGPDNCRSQAAPDADGMVPILSAAGNYNPLWYSVVGTVARPFEGANAITAMRLTSMLICDLLLLLAALVAAARWWSPWLLIGMAAVSTPVVLYATTVAAPNGVQYASGILMWVTLLTVSRQTDTKTPRHLWWLLGLSAGVVATVHTTGPIWIALTGLVSFPVLRTKWAFSWGQERMALGGTLLAVGAISLASVLWTMSAGTNDPRLDDEGFGDFPGRLLIQGPFLWAFQSIATLRFRADVAPLVSYALIGTLMLTLILIGAARAARPARATMLGLVLASTLVPLLLTFLTYSQIGPAWQGRYALPLTVGITLVAAAQLDVLKPPAHWIVWAIGLALAVGQIATVDAMLGERLPGAHQVSAIVLAGLVLVITSCLAGAFLLARNTPRGNLPEGVA